MRFLFPLSLLACIGSFAATLVARGWWHAPAAGLERPSSPGMIAPSARPAEGRPLAETPDVENLSREISERRRRAGILSPEEARAKVEELRGKVGALYEAGDGEGLMRLMREIAAVGPEGYAAALQVLRYFEEQPEGTEYAFGLNLAWFREHAYGGPMVPLMNWALAMPDLAPPWFRRIAAEKLPARPGWDPGRTERLLGWLKVEDDDAIAASLGRGLLSGDAPPPLEDLLESALHADGPGARRAAIRAVALGYLRTEVEASLLGFSEGSDQAAREEALLWLKKPPHRVAAVLRVAPLSRAADLGLQVGDVVISVENRRVLDAESFQLAMDRAIKQMVWPTAQVLRDGKVINLVVRQRHTGTFESPLGLATRPEGYAP